MLRFDVLTSPRERELTALLGRMRGRLDNIGAPVVVSAPLYTYQIGASGMAASALVFSVGYYQLAGTSGLRLSDGWYIETPHDKNGNKYFNVEWAQDIEPEADTGVLDEPVDITLTIRCFERVWSPQTGTYDNGDPVDIPKGRWIDLRLNEVRQPGPEVPDEPEAPHQPTEPGAPVVPHTVTKPKARRH